MDANPLDAALIELADFLDQRQIPYMIIGGVANLFWGEPRSTVDVDVTIFVSEARLSWAISEISKAFHPLVSDTESFIRQCRVFPVENKESVRLDFIFALLPYEEQAIARAVSQDVRGHKVNICAIEDLVIHKIISERSRDKADVEQIMQRQKDKINREYLTPIVKGLAQELERPDIWDRYIEIFPEEGNYA